MPHRIRLRDWVAVEASPESDSAMQRYFNRPTNLDECVVWLRVDAPQGSRCQASLNGRVLTPACDADPHDGIRWRIELESLQPRNELRLTWDAAAPASIEACLEIHE